MAASRRGLLITSWGKASWATVLLPFPILLDFTDWLNMSAEGAPEGCSIAVFRRRARGILGENTWKDCCRVGMRLGVYGTGMEYQEE